MRYFPEYDLYICGDAHFAYAEEVRNLIRENQLTNVFLTDVISQSEKIWLYRNCEAFLFPSEGEGFGLPVVEAMQFGKAVFAANRTSLPEVCNGHAIMWEHLDTEFMVESIREHLPDFIKIRNAWRKSRNMPLHSVTRSIYKPTLIYIGS